jgi:hypothetical protein
MINTLNEKHLHAALKDWYARPDDLIEEKVDGYLVDIVRDGHLIEIQTRNFFGIKRKLAKLTEKHPLRLVYPISKEKWIVRVDRDGKVEGRRRSPKAGVWEHVFDELVYIPHLMARENFSIEVLLIQEEEIRHKTGARAWRRRGWVTKERRLLSVVERRLFEGPESIMSFLPDSLPEVFSTQELAKAVGKARGLAQKMMYCMRAMGAVAMVGKKGNAILYKREETIKKEV